MFNMDSHEKAEHDLVVAARVEQLGLIYQVKANLNGRDMMSVDELYPDIIIIGKNYEIIFIEEIEIASTKNQISSKWTFFNKLYYYKLTPIGIRFRQVNGLTI